MRNRSLFTVIALGALAGGAAAVSLPAIAGAGATRARIAGQALQLSDMQPLIDAGVADVPRSAIDMPACSTCH